MVLRFLKSTRIVNHFLFPFIAMGLWSVHLLSPAEYPFFEGESRFLLFGQLYLLAGHSAMVQTALALVLLIFLGYLVQRLNVEYAFIRIRTLLPAPVFILLASGLTGMHTLHPVYPALLFLLLAVYRLFAAFDIRQPYPVAFDSGLLLGLGSLFYLNLITLLPATLIGLAILSRDTNWRELVIHVIGALLPWVFAFSYYFFFDKLDLLLQMLESCFLTRNNIILTDIPLLVYLGFVALLTLAGSFLIIRQYDEKKVSSRKYFVVLFLLFACSLLSLVLVPAVSREMLLVSAVPVTFLLCNYLVFLKSRFWSEFIFLLLAGLVIYMQFAG